MFIVQEIQTYSNGSIAVLTTQKENDSEAESTYHSILAAAAVSELPIHTAIIMRPDGSTIKKECYMRGDQPIQAVE